MIQKRMKNSYWARWVALFLSYAIILLPIWPSLAMAAKGETIFDQGISKYQSGNFEEALALLTEAAKESPDDPAVPMYLGLAHLKMSQDVEAMAQFEHYLSLQPEGDAADDVRQNITLLKKSFAKEQARLALSGEQAMFSTATGKNTIAVYSPTNMGERAFDTYSRGLSSMIIHDLLQVEKFNIVERVHMQALLDEQAISESGLMERNTSLKTGRLLGAAKVIPGFYHVAGQSMEMNSSILDTASGNTLADQMVRGDLKMFWELEKILVFSILKDLGVEKDAILPDILTRVEKVHTKNWEAFSAYSAGIVATDKEDYVEAKKQYTKALETDRDFGLAARALAALPVAILGTAAILAGLEASAQGVAASSAAAAGSSGMSTWAWIGIGVAAGGGAAAAAGGGGGGGGDPTPEDPGPDPIPPPTQSGTVDITGSWNISATSSNCPGMVDTEIMTITYSDGAYSYNFTVTNGINFFDCTAHGIASCSDSGFAAGNPITESEFTIGFNDGECTSGVNWTNTIFVSNSEIVSVASPPWGGTITTTMTR